MPYFLPEDYERRRRRAEAEMAARGLDALIVSDPANMHWLTGYDGWSFYVHQAVVLSGGGALWWGRGIDAAGAERTVVPGTRIEGYADHQVQNPELHPMTDLAGHLRELGLRGARIGVELDTYYYTAAAHACLASTLPDATLLDATGLINWLRLVKDPAEITLMRRAGRIVEAMHARILEVAEPGLPKHHLVAEIQRAGTRGTSEAWGDYPAIVPMTPSGLDATAPHLTWDDRPIEVGEATFFEIAGVHRRYHAPQSRTIWFGSPPDHFRRAEAAVLAGLEAGFAVARPGNRAEDIAAAFNATLRGHGFEKDNRCGYAIGLAYPPDWGERTVSFRAGDKTVLEPGMAFHFMPALWLEDGGLEISEPLLITERGAERLTTTPQSLFVKT
ncbi:MAG: M24 family metallopeptidase [Pseudomonadota bacterium]